MVTLYSRVWSRLKYCKAEYSKEGHKVNKVTTIYFTRQQMHYLLNLERFKIYIKIHTKYRSYMFRSITIIRELVLNLAKIIFILKHSVKLRRYMLFGDVAACYRAECVLWAVGQARPKFPHTTHSPVSFCTAYNTHSPVPFCTAHNTHSPVPFCTAHNTHSALWHAATSPNNI
jgi:hypothetical protein